MQFRKIELRQAGMPFDFDVLIFQYSPKMHPYEKYGASVRQSNGGTPQVEYPAVIANNEDEFKI